MSLQSWFMEVARGILPSATFEEIYKRAVDKERRAVEDKTPEPKRPMVNVATLMGVANHLGGEDLPAPVKEHAQDRLESRVDPAVTQGDMVDLLRLIQAGGQNVVITGQRMELCQELVVNWRGKHFHVVWSKSRNKLITVFPKRRKKNNKVWKGRPREARIPEFSDIDAD